MTDWKSLAKARQLNLPEADLDRIRGPLDALEQAFHPLAANIPYEIEPAVIFRAEEESE